MHHAQYFGSLLLIAMFVGCTLVTFVETLATTFFTLLPIFIITRIPHRPIYPHTLSVQFALTVAIYALTPLMTAEGLLGYYFQVKHAHLYLYQSQNQNQNQNLPGVYEYMCICIGIVRACACCVCL